MKGYVSTAEAAEAIGVEYATFMARLRKGYVKNCERVGWLYLVPVTEVRRLKRLERKKLANAT